MSRPLHQYSPSSSAQPPFPAENGAKLVERLVLQALPAANLGRRDLTFKTLPLHNNLPPSTIDKTVQDAQANDPTYQPPQVFRLVQSPPSSLLLDPTTN